MQLLSEAQKKMSGYAALCNYRLSNLCVKAEPVALLSISVKVEGQDLPIEKVAQACNAEGRDDQYEIFPLEQEFLIPLVKGIKESHPEFDLDIKSLGDDDDSAEVESEKYIIATVPVINKDRHDAMMQGVKLFSDVCNGQLEAVFTRYTAEITVKLAGASREEIDEVKDSLQDLHDKHKELVQQFCAEKEKEIEDAYAAWQAEQAEIEAKKQEAEAAAQEAQAGLQMKWTPDDDE